MKRINKSHIFSFLLGAILFSGVTYAATLIASDITFDNTKTSMNANNVQDAIEELYGIASNGDTSFGPTKIVPNAGETYKGIVYLDPTNLNNTCNPSNSISTTETKEGCMKWYIFDDSGSNYKMILDHNTTARIKWNDEDKNVAYESSNVKPVVDDLVTNNKWKVTPRLITGQELTNITNNTSWNNSGSWYCFGTNAQDLSAEPYCNTNTNIKYAWLFNNLNACTNSGCSIEDTNTYQGIGTAGEGQTNGYWTSTPVGTAVSGSRVWDVYRYGRLGNFSANNADDGIRPVIEISKSIID